MGPHSRNARLGVLAGILLGSLAWGCTGAGSRSADETSTALAIDALLARASATATAEADWAASMRYVYCSSITAWFSTRPTLGPSSTDAELIPQIEQGRQVEINAAAANCPLPEIEVQRWIADAAHVYFAVAQAAGVPDALNEIVNPIMATYVAATDPSKQQAALDEYVQTIRAWYGGAAQGGSSISLLDAMEADAIQQAGDAMQSHP
jgi:hypothetical protein